MKNNDIENESNDQSQQETENVNKPVEPTPPEGRVIMEDTTRPIKDPNIINKK